MSRCSVHESVDDCWDIELPQVRILLPNPNKDNRFARRVHHVDSSADFLIHSVELGEHYAVDCARIVRVDGKVDQGLVELSQLVNSVIADKSFTDEQDHVWRVDVNKFCQLAHESLIALHATCSVNQHHIVVLVLRIEQSFFGDHSRIIFVALLIERDIEAGSVSCELLDST